MSEALIAANIPLNKLNNPSFRRFLNKYSQRLIPDESTIRKHYVQTTYNNVITGIKTTIANNYLWISADETTDIKGRCVVNVIVGTLNPQQPLKQFLV